MTDDLRQRLADLDPLRTEPTAAAEPPPHLLERIMNLTDTTDSTAGPASATPRRRRRWPAIAGAVAALGLLAGVGAATLLGDEATEPPLELALPGGDPTMGMCLMFDPATLAAMPVAFEGRAVDVANGQVTLDVTRWYRGGDAGQVTLTAADGMVALIDGIEFESGRDYLVTATNGQVNFCGYSALATDELRAVWDGAFGS